MMEIDQKIHRNKTSRKKPLLKNVSEEFKNKKYDFFTIIKIIKLQRWIKKVSKYLKKLRFLQGKIQDYLFFKKFPLLNKMDILLMLKRSSKFMDVIENKFDYKKRDYFDTLFIQMYRIGEYKRRLEEKLMNDSLDEIKEDEISNNSQEELQEINNENLKENNEEKAEELIEDYMNLKQEKPEEEQKEEKELLTNNINNTNNNPKILKDAEVQTDFTENINNNKTNINEPKIRNSLTSTIIYEKPENGKLFISSNFNEFEILEENKLFNNRNDINNNKNNNDFKKKYSLEIQPEKILKISNEFDYQYSQPKRVQNMVKNIHERQTVTKNNSNSTVFGSKRKFSNEKEKKNENSSTNNTNNKAFDYVNLEESENCLGVIERKKSEEKNKGNNEKECEENDKDHEEEKLSFLNSLKKKNYWFPLLLVAIGGITIYSFNKYRNWKRK